MSRKKVLLIVNPCAGRNKSRIETFEIVDRFSSADYDFTVKTTTCQGDATNIVRKYIDDKDLVVCCGGDGTFNETVNGVMQLPRRVPIGYIPAGSTNDLANTMGLPLNIIDATDNIIVGKTNSYDIGLFNNRFFSYIASFGACTHLAYSTSQKLKNKFGHSAYVLDGVFLNLPTTLKSIKPHHARIEYDGNVIEDDFYFGAVTNSTSVGGIFGYSRDTVRLDDGKFEMLLVRGIKTALDVIPLLSQARRQDYSGDKIIFLQTSNLNITFDKEVPWTLDGEFGGDLKNVRISVLNRAIDIISGPNSLFAGDEIDIPVYDVAEANAKDGQEETPIEEKARRFRHKYRAKKEEEHKAKEEKQENQDNTEEESAQEEEN